MKFPALVCSILLLAVHSTAAHAQRSLAQLREELVAPWLISIEGDDRTGLLRISEIAQESEGSYLMNATQGRPGGESRPVRVELIQAGQELRLIFRSSAGDLFSLREVAGGRFAGTYRTQRGVEKPLKLERLTEDQVAQKAQEDTARAAARVYANEDKDWGVAPTKSARTGRLHAPTPKELPGAKTIRTMELRAMQGQSPAPILIDVLGGQGHRTVSGAHWLREPGEASFGNAERERFREDLEKLTAGRKSAPIVFFCLSSECWMSYNAGLRAMELGYTNVHWFRGGTEAWRRAGFETREAEPFRR